jgi:hypothetical protein
MSGVQEADGPVESLEEVPARTTRGVARDAVLSITQIVEDSAELVSATLREELERFRREAAKGAISAAAALAGGSLLTAGLSMYLARILESWPLTLCLFGVLYLGIAAAFQMRSK